MNSLHFSNLRPEQRKCKALLSCSLFFSVLLFFKGRWKERGSKGARLTPVSVTAQAREILGKDPLAAIWNCPLPDSEALTDGAALCSHMVKHLEGPANRCWCQRWEGEPSHYWKPDLWEAGAISREFCFMLHCPLCAQASAWHWGKARPSLAVGELWLEERASSSVLITQRGVFTTLYTKHFFPSLHILGHAPSFYSSKPQIWMNNLL